MNMDTMYQLTLEYSHAMKSHDQFYDTQAINHRVAIPTLDAHRD